MLSFDNIAELSDLHHSLPEFEAKLLTMIQRLNLSLQAHHADHISVRCFQQSTAERWKSGLLRCGELISEKNINGRPICLFSLNQPLQVGPWQIDCVELPYPGEKLYPKESWEHIEWVVPGDAENFHQTALSLFSDEILLMPQLKLKFSNPAGEGEALQNPTLAVTEDGITIKFHPYSIREIVRQD
ncbi:VOC family protein [Budvicia aquatica]|uniref:VOC family protein n=1 Tax=Budvicia aquatica TaxID=82979 RepID=A0A2C6CW34_9GAMM|nr:VOC family protein [Budvicia aquatica]PHI30859.1 VOC family protein [Budvicia aquatica]